MMMSQISPTQGHALAALVATLRPEWDTAGITAAIREARNDHDVRAICHAAIELAFLPDVRTPKVLVHAGPHWQQTATTGSGQRPEPTIPCPEHGGITKRIDQYGRSVYACCLVPDREPPDYQRNRPDVDVTAKTSRCLDAMRGTNHPEGTA